MLYERISNEEMNKRFSMDISKSKTSRAANPNRPVRVKQFIHELKSLIEKYSY